MFGENTSSKIFHFPAIVAMLDDTGIYWNIDPIQHAG